MQNRRRKLILITIINTPSAILKDILFIKCLFLNMRG